MSFNLLLDAEVTLPKEAWTSSFKDRLAIGGLDGIRVFDREEKQEPVYQISNTCVVSLDQPIDSSFLITNSIHSLLSRYSRDGSLETCYQIKNGQAWLISLCPANNDVLATAGSNGVLHFLDASSGNFGNSLSFVQTKKDFITACCFSPDGTQVAIASKAGEITLVDSSNGSITHSFPAHASAVRSLTFSPDSSILISGGDDKRMNLFDIRGHDHRRRLGGNVASVTHTGWVTSLACRSDGKLLASGSTDGTVKVFDLGRHQFSHPLTTLAAQFVFVLSHYNVRLITHSTKDVWTLAFRPHPVATGLEGIGAGATQSMLVSASAELRWWRSQGSN